jgi:hypothetical protein
MKVEKWVKLLSSMGLTLSIISLLPTTIFGFYLAPLHEFKKVLGYFFGFIALYVYIGVVGFALFSFARFVAKNDFIKVLFGFLIDFNENSYKKLKGYFTSSSGVNSFS